VIAMIARVPSLLLALALSFGLSIGRASAQDTIKVGYWTSGFSVGFGAVLEVGKFLEAEGLAPEFIKFSDVNGPTKALLTNSIDVAFAAPTSGAFTLGAEGAPVELVLATQVAEATFVSKPGSPIKTILDLKGKKLGMSPVGSATYAIAAAVLEHNYGLRPSDYTPIPGNEGQLLQFLTQGDIDAALLRAVTIASVPDLALQTFGRIVDEWQRMTNSNAVPILGVTLVHQNYARSHPEGVVKFIKGMIAAVKFGHADTARASDILRQTANLDARDATAYAKLWDQIYMASLEPRDVATLTTMAEIFRSNKLIEGQVPATLFVSTPYEQAKR
jgi:ABC-type nitrate/sulfonate/bicarbonate transport system substrate-binding protein